MLQRIREQWKIGAGIIGILVSLLVYVLLNRPSGNFEQVGFVASMPESESSAIIESMESESEPMLIYVDLKGAVQQPNVYPMEQGARVFDLIEKAGGFLPDAAQNQVNLAQLLSDQQLVYVPFEGEESQAVETPIATSNNASGLINLNTATVDELQTLPGIGKSKAEAIIAHRTQNGSFQTIEALQEVKGIGAKSFEALAPLITVGP